MKINIMNHNLGKQYTKATDRKFVFQQQVNVIPYYPTSFEVPLLWKVLFLESKLPKTIVELSRKRLHCAQTLCGHFIYQQHKGRVQSTELHDTISLSLCIFALQNNDRNGVR